MAQVRGTYPALYDNVEKTIDAILRTALKEMPVLWKDLLNVQTSTKKFERTATVTPFGDVPEKGEGNIYSLDLIRPGYTKDFTHTEFGLGFEVTETAEEDDQYDILVRSGEWLAFSARTVQEKRAADLFNLGFTTELTGDGKPLFATDHTLAAGGTARNELSTSADLSTKSLTDALTDMQTQTKIESGQIVAPITDLILCVHPSNEMMAERILSSTGYQGTGDNDINALRTRRKWKIHVNPFFTDEDAFFIVPQSKRMHGLTSYVRVPISKKPARIDPYTENLLYKIRFRQSWGAKWWQGVFGSPGA